MLLPLNHIRTCPLCHIFQYKASLFTDIKCETKNCRVPERTVIISTMRTWPMSSPMECRSCLSVSRDETISWSFPRPSTRRRYPSFASSHPSPSFLCYTLRYHTVQKAITGSKSTGEQLCEAVIVIVKKTKLISPGDPSSHYSNMTVSGAAWYIKRKSFCDNKTHIMTAVWFMIDGNGNVWIKIFMLSFFLNTPHPVLIIKSENDRRRTMSIKWHHELLNSCWDISIRIICI